MKTSPVSESSIQKNPGKADVFFFWGGGEKAHLCFFVGEES